MAENSNIAWCDHTFNPWEGCTKIGPGCDHCYAENRNQRFSKGINWGKGAPRRRTSEANWKLPLKWNREAERLGIRYRVFCSSLADVFDNEVDPDWRIDLFDLIRKTPSLNWLLLSKRVGNISGMINRALRNAHTFQEGEDLFVWLKAWDDGVPPKNVWLGATVVNQEEADRDIPKLLIIPAAVRFLSMEPLLGPVDLTFADNSDGIFVQKIHGVDWCIIGGESGPHARPMHPDWVRSLRDQCRSYGVPFLFKQWGEFAPEVSVENDGSPGNGTYLNNSAMCICEKGERIYRVGKNRAGRQLDGKTYSEYPFLPPPLENCIDILPHLKEGDSNPGGLDE